MVEIFGPKDQVQPNSALILVFSLSCDRLRMGYYSLFLLSKLTYDTQDREGEG